MTSAPPPPPTPAPHAATATATATELERTTRRVTLTGVFLLVGAAIILPLSVALGGGATETTAEFVAVSAIAYVALIGIAVGAAIIGAAIVIHVLGPRIPVLVAGRLVLVDGPGAEPDQPLGLELAGGDLPSTDTAPGTDSGRGRDRSTEPTGTSAESDTAGSDASAAGMDSDVPEATGAGSESGADSGAGSESGADSEPDPEAPRPPRRRWRWVEEPGPESGEDPETGTGARG